MNDRKPLISNARIAPTVSGAVRNEKNEQYDIAIAGEHPLALYVDRQEVVTMMTLGQMPEALAIGWLRNQQLISSLAELEEVRVDWEVNAAAVYTRAGDFSARAMEEESRVITSGCGQGTMFSRLLEDIEHTEFCRTSALAAAALFDLLDKVRNRDTVYKQAGAVHACLLAEHDGATASPLIFVEDIGRHNAVDAIAGWMWLNDVDGDDKVFYTTGRLTSEMVIKCVQMRIPYLVSRSGVTRMGYEVANKAGITVIGRAINRRYLVFSGDRHLRG